MEDSTIGKISEDRGRYFCSSILAPALEKAISFQLRRTSFREVHVEGIARSIIENDGWSYPDLDNVDTSVSSALEEFIRSIDERNLGWITTEFGEADLNGEKMHKSLLWYCWTKYHSFKLSPDQIEQISLDLIAFLSQESFTIDFVVPLVNFSLLRNSEGIYELGQGFQLRKLDNKTLTELYGGFGPVVFDNPARPLGRMAEWAIEGRIKISKNYGRDLTELKTPQFSQLRDKLNALMRAFTIVKGGKIGFFEIAGRTDRYLPIALISHLDFGSHVPIGMYEILDEEVSQIRLMLEVLCAQKNPTLEFPAGKLYDAELRTNPVDAILDAAIGLESILLYGQKQELNFRFALAYSTLSPTLTRRVEYYDLAKLVYSARSNIAHGDLNISEKHNGATIGPAEISQLAKDMLRELLIATVNRRIENYQVKNFWRDRILGL